MDRLPTVSVVIPTLNAAAVLPLCLEAIAGQDYPRERVEVVVIDGGSADGTIEIAGRYTDLILENPLKTGEAGKAAGARAARHDIVAFIDSDNILPTRDWFRRMVEPFEDPEIVASEPIEYTYRREDGFITRYCALIGMNDPLCLFLGNYDRMSLVTGRWTEMPVEVEDCGTYLKVGLPEPQRLPTIGANGFLIRRRALLGCEIGDYLFDVDIIYHLLMRGAPRFAKVKVGIVHLFSGNLSTFIRKQRRRIQDYTHHSRQGVRKYPWDSVRRRRLPRFILFCLLVAPLLWQSFRGFRSRPDVAWFFHPLACWLTLTVYGAGWLGGMVRRDGADRSGWHQ